MVITNIYIVDSSGGQLKPLTSESDRVSFRPIAWSPDGKLMAYYSHAQEKWGEGTLNVIPTDGGKSRAIGMVQGMHVNKELAWSPDCTRIAFNGKGDEKIIKIISLDRMGAL